MHAIVLSTCGSRNEAEKIARDAVERRLAACVNIVPVISYYRWNGKIRVDREYLLMAKTRSEVFARLKRRILALHTYELPEILSLKVLGGHKQYLDWIDEEVHK
jgi:periplasmic divalent cation tolerance protein